MNKTGAIYENLGIKIPKNLLHDCTSVKKDNYENIEIEPYNKIYENIKLTQNDNEPNKIIYCYNQDCNILNPTFGDTSYVTDDWYTTENKNSNK